MKRERECVCVCEYGCEKERKKESESNCDLVIVCACDRETKRGMAELMEKIASNVASENQTQKARASVSACV